jgi:transposase-like protein
MVFLHPVLETLSMPQGKPRDPRKEQHWRQLLERWQDSGLSVRVFCRRHRLAEPTFYAWRRTLAQRQAPNPAADEPLTFVPLTIRHDTPSPPAPALELVLGDSRLLRIPQGFDPAALRALLAALEGHSC